MARTSPSKSPSALLNAIDALEEIDTHSDAFTLDDLSNLAMLDSLGADYELIQLRFTGNLAGRHSIGLREATEVLGAFQDVISEVGASLSEESPRRGPLASNILRETELQLSPHVSPGSVIFSVHPARENPLFEPSDLLDRSLSEVLNLFDQVERPVSSGVTTPDAVAEVLRRFGPRTARNLVRFASALAENALNIDIGIAKTGLPIKGSKLSKAGAGFLRSLAENATTRDSEITIVGEVQNLGRDNKYKVVAEGRGRISVEGTEDITDVLQEAFRRHKVRIRLQVNESVNLATGALSNKYVALEANILTD